MISYLSLQRLLLRRTAQKKPATTSVTVPLAHEPRKESGRTSRTRRTVYPPSNGTAFLRLISEPNRMTRDRAVVSSGVFEQRRGAASDLPASLAARGDEPAVTKAPRTDKN